MLRRVHEETALRELDVMPLAGPSSAAIAYKTRMLRGLAISLLLAWGCGGAPSASEGAAPAPSPPAEAPVSTQAILDDAFGVEPSFEPAVTTPEPPPACTTASVDEALGCPEITTSSDPVAATTHEQAAQAARGAGDPWRCAAEYVAAIDAESSSPQTEARALAAFRCAYTTDLRDADQRAWVSLSDEHEVILEASARRVACFARSSPQGTEAMQLLGNWLYSAEHYAEAAPLFFEVTQGHATPEATLSAALLSLDALNQRARQEPRAAEACLGMMQRLVPVYRARFCAGQLSRTNVDQCDVFARLACSVGRRDAESLASRERFAEASIAYEQLAANSDCSSDADLSLANAAHAAERAGDAARAAQLRAELRRLYPGSSFATPP